MPMKLILRADVDNLGRLGDVVSVKPGYGRNFLIPQGLAMPATNSNMKVFEQEKNRLQKMADELRASANELAAKLSAATLDIRVRVGEGGKLYGSVTAQDLGKAIEDKGIEFDRRKIELEAPIRDLGVYAVPVRLHPDVECELTVHVLRHGATAEEDEAVLNPVVEEPEIPEAEKTAEAPAEVASEVDAEAAIDSASEAGETAADAQPEEEPA